MCRSCFHRRGDHWSSKIYRYLLCWLFCRIICRNCHCEEPPQKAATWDRRECLWCNLLRNKRYHPTGVCHGPLGLAMTRFSLSGSTGRYRSIPADFGRPQGSPLRDIPQDFRDGKPVPYGHFCITKRAIRESPLQSSTVILSAEAKRFFRLRPQNDKISFCV